MSIAEIDPSETKEVEIDEAVNSIFSGVSVLAENKHNNEAREYILNNGFDLELAYVQLGAFLDHMMGKH